MLQSNTVLINIKRLHPDAIIPAYAKPGDAGVDLTAISKEWDEEHQVIIFGTGIAMEIPEGYVGLIFPRSSIFKVPLSLTNCVGVIDSGYRGEIKFMFRTVGRPQKNYEVGDRVGQLIVVPFPKINFMQVPELASSVRGGGGFGSSGK